MLVYPTYRPYLQPVHSSALKTNFKLMDLVWGANLAQWPFVFKGGYYDARAKTNKQSNKTKQKQTNR